MQLITIERSNPLDAVVSGVEWRAAIRRRGDLARPTAVLVDRMFLLDMNPSIAYQPRGSDIERFVTLTLGRLVVEILDRYLVLEVRGPDGRASDIRTLYREGYFDVDPIHQGQAGVVLAGQIMIDGLPADFWIKRNPRC